MHHSFFWWNYFQGRRAGTDIEKGLVDTESEGVCRTSRERIETYILWSESASQSCLTLCEPMDCSPPGSFCPLNSPGKNIRVGSHSLLQGIFPTKGSNPHFLHYRQILYHLNHQGSLHTHSVQFSHSVMSDSLWTHESQHARPPCPSPTPGVYSDSCPLSRWCHPIISSSVDPFSSRLQSFPAWGSFQISQFFTSGGPSIGV